MITGGECGDRLGQFLGERGAVGRAGEADLRIERERGEPLVLTPSPLGEARQLANGARGERHEIRGGVPVGHAAGVGAERPERFGAHDVSLRAGAKHPLDAVAFPALGDELDQPPPLELPEVVVDSLAWQVKPPGEAAGGLRFGQLAEQAQAIALEQGGSGFGLAEDG